MRSHFQTSLLLYDGKKGPVFESNDGGAQSYERHRQVFTLCTKLLVGVVSLPVFGGNFVLAKVCLGVISVRHSKLGGVRFEIY